MFECVARERTLWVFNHYAEEPKTGTGLRHYHFARQLADRGWKVRIFAASTVHQSSCNFVSGREPYVEKVIDGVSYVFISARPYEGNGKLRILNILDYVKGCRRQCGNFEKPDVILASSVHPLAWYLGKHFASRYGVPWVCEVRDLWPEALIELGYVGRESAIAKSIRAYEKCFYKKSDALVFTMPGGPDYVESRGWTDVISPQKTHWISNGIDLKRFAQERSENVVENMGAGDSECFRLLYCGSLGETNALECFFGAMRILKERGVVDVELHIFGDGCRKEALERECADAGLSNVLFKGRVEKRYIPYLVSNADINLLAATKSNLQNYGCSFNKLYDYLAAGKPFISNVSFAYSDFEARGCCVVAENETEIADAICSIKAMSKEDRDDMGRRCFELAKEYDFGILADRLIGVFDQVLAR